MEKKRLSFKIGLGFAIAHLLLFIGVLHTAFTSGSGQAGMGFILFWYLDFFMLPLFFNIPLPVSFIVSHIIYFGVLGTLAWFFIPILASKVYRFFTRPKVKEQFK